MINCLDAYNECGYHCGYAVWPGEGFCWDVRLVDKGVYADTKEQAENWLRSQGVARIEESSERERSMVKSSKCTRITLSLNEEEATLLRNMMQNPIHHIPMHGNPTSESIEERELSGELLGEFDGQLHG